MPPVFAAIGTIGTLGTASAAGLNDLNESTALPVISTFREFRNVEVPDGNEHNTSTAFLRWSELNVKLLNL
jgi:hypothetical protein